MKLKTIAVAFGALAFLSAGLFWLSTRKIDSPLDRYPKPSPSKKVAAPVEKKPSPPAAVVSVLAPDAPPRDRRAIDPEIQKLADRLTEHSQTPINDLEIVNEFFTMYLKTFSQLPVGSNEDLTAILTGGNPKKGVLFPADSPMIIKGQIVDRWGSPYWLHPTSGADVEIRSAGPDKSLFTSDDVILNASPSGLGATPNETL